MQVMKCVLKTEHTIAKRIKCKHITYNIYKYMKEMKEKRKPLFIFIQRILYFFFRLKTVD